MTGPADPRYQLLVGQVKVLLRAEQRLLRSQRGVESQLRRFRSFNAFAMEAPKCRGLEEILDSALRLLWPIFTVQAGLAVRWGPEPMDLPDLSLWLDARLREVPPSLARSCDALARDAWSQRAAVLPEGAPPPGTQALVDRLDALAPASPWERRAQRHRTMLLPFGRRPGDGAGALLLCRCAGFSRHEETPELADQPFLEAVCVHAASAMEIVAFQAGLERRVEARTLDLAVANEQLRMSLRALGEAQARLVESSRLAAVGQLAATVAHDLANPLAALKSNVTWLGRAEQQPGEVDERAEVLADALAALERISQRVQHLRRLEHREEASDLPGPPEPPGRP